MPLRRAFVRDDDLYFAGANGKADGAGPAAGADGARQRAAQVSDQWLYVGTSEAQMQEHGVGDVGQHAVEGRLLGERERKQEFGIGHEAGFYSERRSKSTRARPQSAAICVLSWSSESNARSSRSRWTKPRRIEAP